MTHEKPGEGAATNEAPSTAYEPPRIETVLTADDVEREALYGGASQK